MSPLRTERTDGVLMLTLDRPERANAFDRALIADLLSALDEAAADGRVRSLILTGAGRVFSAGQDLQEMLGVAGKVSYREHLHQTYNALILRLRCIEKPVIAAVNGACAGAALGVALACDLRLAAESARFVFGFPAIGLAPDSGVSLLLPAVVGLGRATQLALTNQPLSAAQALEWGLVGRVLPDADLPAAALDLARSLAAGPAGAFGLTKRAFNAAVLPDLERVLGVEADLQEEAGRSQEHLLSLQAFLDRRM